ncbi:hypothetical protein H7K32_11470 [Brevibacillus agri]|uniref:hypothetical protein n=1 Tax=Brevibacillus agri TaxID=51101 RepID=UPI001C8E9F72|nr:hypothetical protein [Brevibacillus agri]MBY0052291.1 hypothetical protein [Brevibacillus agri]
MDVATRLKKIREYQELIDKTIDASRKMIDIATRDGRELGVREVSEHLRFLEKKKEELQKEYDFWSKV